MEEATFSLFRYDPDADSKPHFQRYQVPMRPALTVLDGLYYIQRYLDGSIAFRSSCRAAVCGSCAMHINGVYRLACETQVSSLRSNTVTIRPLGHLEVIRDLVVDMGPFWDKYKLIKPYLIAGRPPPEQERIQSIDEREILTGLIDCILCGACSSSCAVTQTDNEYLGPAALLKTHRFIADSRDQAAEERLKTVDGDHGVWRCHTIFSCQKVCPKQLNPTASIADMKRSIIGKKMRFSR